LRDVDGDCETEILVGTMANGNGDSAGGTDDLHTYVLLLDATGRPRWVQRIGKYSSAVVVSWLADSSSLDPSILAVEMGSQAGDRTCDSVFVLDSRSGSVVARAQYGTYNTMRAVLGDESGTSILISGADDTLRSLDPMTLGLRREGAVPCGLASPVALGDNSIGSGLAVAPTTDGRLLVVSTSGGVMCEVPSCVVQEVHPVAGAPAPTFLTGAFTGGRQVWRLYSINAPVSVWHRQVSVVTLVAVLLLAVVAFGSALVVARYRQTRDMRLVVRGLTGQAGIIEIDSRGRVRHTNARARGLLGGDTVPAGPLAQAVRSALAEPPGSMPRELPVALDGGRTVLARAARVRSGVMLALEDISAVEYLQRVKAWAPVAQKLAHGIKNPLGTIMGAVEQIESEMARRQTKSEARSERPEARSTEEDQVKGQEPRAETEDGTKAEARGERLEARSQESETRTLEPLNPRTPLSDERVKKYIGYVKDEVTRLKKMTDAFMRFTKLNPPALQSRNVNELVRKVVAKYEGTLAEGISLEMDLDDKLPPVALDEEGMSSVLDIVIENAIEAMQSKITAKSAKDAKIESDFTTKTQSGLPPNCWTLS